MEVNQRHEVDSFEDSGALHGEVSEAPAVPEKKKKRKTTRLILDRPHVQGLWPCRVSIGVLALKPA